MICTGCKQNRSSKEFYRHPSIKPNGIRRRCRRCRNKYRRRAHKKNPEVQREQAREWIAKNREKVNARAREYRAENPNKFKSYALKRDFDITLAQYQGMVKRQKGKCKLCGRPERSRHQNGKKKKLAIDHDHLTGKIRGLLCWVCNTGIGKLQDNPKLLRKAAKYIENIERKDKPCFASRLSEASTYPKRLESYPEARRAV